MAEMVISHALSWVLNLARFDFRTVTLKTPEAHTSHKDTAYRYTP
jgi:hypothetical protein